MSCPRASFGSATTVSSPIGFAPRNSRYAGSCWRWKNPNRDHLPREKASSIWHCPRCRTAMVVAQRLTAAEISGAATSMLRRATIICDLSTCGQHANVPVCSQLGHRNSQRFNRRVARKLDIPAARLPTQLAAECSRLAAPSSALQVPSRGSIPIAAASAANTSGFLQVSLSKTPRLGSTSSPEAFHAAGGAKRFRWTLSCSATPQLGTSSIAALSPVRPQFHELAKSVPVHRSLSSGLLVAAGFAAQRPVWSKPDLSHRSWE